MSNEVNGQLVRHACSVHLSRLFGSYVTDEGKTQKRKGGGRKGVRDIRERARRKKSKTDYQKIVNKVCIRVSTLA